MAAMAGIIYASRLNSATPLAGQGYELDAIASCVIGGTSVSGGEGSIVGTMIGVLLLNVVSNMFNLLGIQVYVQYLIKGIIILTVVGFDSYTRHKQIVALPARGDSFRTLGLLHPHARKGSHHRRRRVRPVRGLLPADERLRHGDLRDAQPAGRGLHRLEARGLHLRRLHPLAHGLRAFREHAPGVAGAARRAGPAFRGVGRVHARAPGRRGDLHDLHRPAKAGKGNAAPGPGGREAHRTALRRDPQVFRGRHAGHHREDGPVRAPGLPPALDRPGAGHEDLEDHERPGLLRPAAEPHPGGGPGHAFRRREQHARFPDGRPGHDAGLHAQEVQRLPHRRLAGVRPGHHAPLPGAGRPHPLQRARGEDPGGAGQGRGRRQRRAGAPGRRGDLLRRRARHPVRHARGPLPLPRAAHRLRFVPGLPLADLRGPGDRQGTCATGRRPRCFPCKNRSCWRTGP